MCKKLLLFFPICGVLVVGGQVNTRPSSVADGLKGGDWSIRAVAFSAEGHIFVSDGLQKKPRRIAEGSDPEWSPDGSKIAFAAIGDHGEKFEIYTVNPDGSDKKRLTQKKGGTGASTPAWSADGKKIAFTILEQHSGIYVMNQDGSNAHFVTEGLNPQWSPDGHRLVFFRFSKSHKDKSSVWVANADGTEAKQITDENSMSWFPRWTRDDKILFASDREGRSAIYLMNSDGSSPQRLVYSKDSEFLSPVISPDNKQLVVLATHSVEVSGQRAYTVPTILLIELNTSHQTRRIAEKGSHTSILWVQN